MKFNLGYSYINSIITNKGYNRQFLELCKELTNAQSEFPYAPEFTNKSNAKLARAITTKMNQLQKTI